MNIRSLFSKKPDDGTEHAIELKKLSKIPLANRDIEWDNKFMKYLGKARLACKVPQLGKMKDGFTYFQLEIPDIGAPYQAYTLADLIEDHLLKDGYGACVFSYGEDPDRQFSYGELLNYHYRKEFRSKVLNWLKPSPDQLSRYPDIIGGDPQSAILHPLTRKVILAYLVKNGFHFPKVTHLNINTEDGIMNQLVFNLEPHMFETRRHFEDVLSSLQWFLPVHYTYTAIPEKYLSNIFYDL